MSSNTDRKVTEGDDNVNPFEKSERMILSFNKNGL